MSRKKGSEKTGGRVAGTPNRVTSDLKTWVASILDNGRDKFVESLDKLEPSEYTRVFTGLLNYTLPKQAPTTPDDILKKEKEMMQELLLGLPEEAIDRVAKRLQELQKKEEDENKSE
jgi:hypothetical protein